MNEAALWAARQNKKEVEVIDFEMAKDKVLMGAERKSMILSDEEKRTTAYHEAGHALMAKLLPGTDPVHKVTIIPRGRALGVTMQLPTDDRHNYSKEFLYNNLAILMGGRVAEELVLKHITTGAGNDIERATDLARKMVCEWGMSEKLGPLTFGRKEEEIFLGRELTTKRDFSEQVALEIDLEVKRLVTENYERAKRLLTEHMRSLKALAEALLEKGSAGCPGDRSDPDAELLADRACLMAAKSLQLQGTGVAADRTSMHPKRRFPSLLRYFKRDSVTMPVSVKIQRLYLDSQQGYSCAVL